jgi:hypothetical protein
MATASGTTSWHRKEALMIKVLKQILTTYFEVATFKRSPLDTPSNRFMLGISAGLVLLANLCQILMVMLLTRGLVSIAVSEMLHSMGYMLLSTMAQILFFALFVRVVLHYHRASTYFYQFMICWLMMLFFIEVVPSLVMLLFKLLLLVVNLSLDSISSALLVISLVLAIWKVSFMVHLFRVVLDKTFLYALMLCLAWFAINALVFYATQFL